MLKRIQHAQGELEQKWPTMLQEEIEKVVHEIDGDLFAEEALDPIIKVIGVSDPEGLHHFPKLRKVDLY